MDARAVILLVLLLVPTVLANQYEFVYQGDTDEYVGAYVGGEYFGLSAYQVLFILGYAMVVFGVVMQGFSRIKHFNKRLSVGISLGITLISLVPVLPWVATQDFRYVFRGMQSFSVMLLLAIGMITFYLVYKTILGKD